MSPDQQRLASASSDATVRIWDMVSGRELILLRGHEGRVRKIAFSPEGQQVASVGDDGTVRIWVGDQAAGTPLTVLHGHESDTTDVTFSPDGLLASSGGDGTVRIWDCEVCGRPIQEVLALSEQRVTRSLTCEERMTFLHGQRCS